MKFKEYITNEQLAGRKLKEFLPLIEILRTSKTKEDMKTKIFKWLNSKGVHTE